ncbi:hypothetical protein PVK06_017426 [Gossypium arboreum]|uniref:Uncharacterized protein n=1 Tax=Gossypium arboreum TaxID=29729 RepID=A0ABR0Q2P3_GOSAR|nr:hypothetical protein PVK06_017426 [Gossypium arboreum]
MSFGKMGFVRWYLGKVKSWPVLIKSDTSLAIYVAADLSAQRNNDVDKGDEARKRDTGGE